MALAKETVLQIIACHAQGMTVREIDKKAKLDAAQVEVCLLDNGKKPIYNKTKQVKDEVGKKKRYPITDEQKEEIRRLVQEGYTQDYIAKKVGVGAGSVSRILNANKEKEPAAAATVTDSIEIKTDDSEISNTVSISKDTTGAPKSQEVVPELPEELNGIDALAVLETVLDNWLGIEGRDFKNAEAKVVSLSAYPYYAELSFEHKGNTYTLVFRKECRQ